jgi:hypothetical protein
VLVQVQQAQITQISLVTAGYSSASNSNFIGYQEYATSAYNSNFFIKLE